MANIEIVHKEMKRCVDKGVKTNSPQVMEVVTWSNGGEESVEEEARVAAKDNGDNRVLQTDDVVT